MSDSHELFNQALAHHHRAFERRRQLNFPDKPQLLPAGNGAPSQADLDELDAAEAEWLAATAELERISKNAP